MAGDSERYMILEEEKANEFVANERPQQRHSHSAGCDMWPILKIFAMFCVFTTVVIIGFIIIGSEIKDQSTAATAEALREPAWTSDLKNSLQSMINSSKLEIQSMLHDFTRKVEFILRWQKAGYTLLGGRAVKLFKVPLSWETAEARCKENGGNLITAADNVTNKWLAQQRAKTIWIGLNDKGHEGNWTWANGSPLLTGNFWRKDPKEPNDFEGREDCAALLGADHPTKSSVGTWIDFDCRRDKAAAYACELTPEW